MMAQSKSNEWTHVPARKSHKATVNPSLIRPDFQLDREATIGTLKAKLDHHKACWLKHDLRKAVHKTIQRAYTNDPFSISKAICLGLGSLTTLHVDHCATRVLQLAVFLDIVEQLKTLHEIDISMTAQEPSFSDIDKQFLATLNITVVDCVECEPGQLGPITAHLDKSAFVADYFVKMDIGQQVLPYEPSLLISALPGAIDHGSSSLMYFDTAHRDLLQQKYRWQTLATQRDEELALVGLYVCWLQTDEAVDEFSDMAGSLATDHMK